MQLHELKPNFKNKRKKRVGRGGKRGTYSGRGIKGQKARAGRKIPSREKEMITRFPKLKGTGNVTVKKPRKIFSLDQLERIAEKGVVNKDILMKKGFIKKTAEDVKILGDGEVSNKFKVEGIETSKSAKEKIEKAGGKVS